MKLRQPFQQNLRLVDPAGRGLQPRPKRFKPTTQLRQNVVDGFTKPARSEGPQLAGLSRSILVSLYFFQRVSEITNSFLNMSDQIQAFTDKNLCTAEINGLQRIKRGFKKFQNMT
ncbi:hypothetical protein [Methylomicrobium sp. Wu6]|uniref:hypothetical protein n=1 Tax=Methylomicrobium sp. Wu6 TaxID=3107928 RepID=UPI002DD66C00|nr:hypothetical protein [Methylomicrobium sp. Wu6]MEC4749974.1 hypothetical protein [Methylomicrobium sp. Wu6]